MYQIKGYFSSLKGNHYEIGKQQGELVKKHPHPYSDNLYSKKI